ncbi:hypothetical protein [Ranid herpesvirus 3]|uniref:Uncharacterized protein n=1 Tax=Ranid herpesvirus 3 TaxID=1987509 RepID=A0A1X9T552_9VIRU|nr:hypothetical protein [Ranid herpesvirus 3]ARR28829.1 hypothetical protein [Ranid herpesvirus 3]
MSSGEEADVETKTVLYLKSCEKRMGFPKAALNLKQSVEQRGEMNYDEIWKEITRDGVINDGRLMSFAAYRGDTMEVVAKHLIKDEKTKLYILEKLPKEGILSSFLRKLGSWTAI